MLLVAVINDEFFTVDQNKLVELLRIAEFLEDIVGHLEHIFLQQAEGVVISEVELVVTIVINVFVILCISY